ncbi:hypothetical protein IJG14_07920 [bacterium]|nr:hypothetical protein [bacterium]
MANYKLRSCMALAACMVMSNCVYADDGYNLTDGQSILLEADKYITNTVNTENTGRYTTILAAGNTSINTGDYTLTAEASGASARNYIFNTNTDGTNFTFTGNLYATASGTGSVDNRGLRQNALTTTNWIGNIVAGVTSQNSNAIGIDIWNGSTANFSGDLTDITANVTGTGYYCYALQNHTSDGSQVYLNAAQTNLKADGGTFAEAMAVHQGSVYLNGNANITALNGKSGTRAINVEGDLGNPYDSVVSLKGNVVNVTASSDKNTIGLFSSGSQSLITSDVVNLTVNSTSNDSYAFGILSQYGANVNLLSGTNTTVSATGGTDAYGVVSQDAWDYPGHFASHGTLTSSATGVTAGYGVLVENDSSFIADQLTSTGTATGEDGAGIGAVIVNSTDVVIGSDGKTSSLKGVADNGIGIGLHIEASEEEHPSDATLKGVMTVEGSSTGINIEGYSTLTNAADLTVKGGIHNEGTFINNAKLQINGTVKSGDNGGAIHNESTITSGDNAQYTLTENSADQGGAIYNTGTINVSDDAVFSSNTAYKKGGAVYNSGTMTIGDGASFTGNKTTWDGAAGSGPEDTNSNGGAIWNSGTLTIGDNATFTDNHASHLVTSGNGHGADVYNYAGTVTIGDNLTITRTSEYPFSDYHDCAMFIAGGTLNIGDNALIENVREAIVTSDNAIVNIGDNLHIQNTANGIASWGDQVNVGKNATFENIIGNARVFQTVTSTGQFTFDDGLVVKNNMTKTFGNIYNEQYNTVMTFNGSAEFANNSAQLQNVGVFQNWGTLDFKGNTKFEGNTAYLDAGAIRNRGASSITTFHDTVLFKDNAALHNGGAIVNQGSLTFNGEATFTGNIAGALSDYVENENGFFVDSETDKHYSWVVNGVDADGSYDGGAIHNTANVTFNDAATFSNNIASGLGGAIYNTASITFNDGATFSNNTIGAESPVKNDIYNTGTITFNGTTSLDGGITGTGTTTIGSDAVVSIAKGGVINQGTVNLNGTLDLTNNTAESNYNFDNLAGAGILKIDFTKSGDSVVSDTINASNYDSLTSLQISSINDLTSGYSTTNDFTVTVLNGYTGDALSVASDVLSAYSGTKLIHETYSQDLVASVDWTNNVFGSREWDNQYTTNLVVDGGALQHTSVYDGEVNIVENFGDTLRLLNQATGEGFATKSMITTDATASYLVGADLGTTKGTLNVKGASDGSNTSTIDMNSKGGFVVADGATLNLDTVKFIGAKSEDASLINNTAGTVNLNNVEVDTNSANIIANNSTLNMTGTNTINAGIKGTGTTNINSGIAVIKSIAQNLVNIAGNTKLTVVDANVNEIANAGELTFNNGTTSSNVTGTGTTKFEGNVNNSGSIEQTQVINNGNLTNTGAITAETIINNGLETSFNNNAVITGNLNNSGYFSNSTDGVINGNVINSSMLFSSADGIKGSVDNTGDYNILGGTVIAPITGSGNVMISEDVTLGADASVTQNSIAIYSDSQLNGKIDQLNLTSGVYNSGTLALNGTGELKTNVLGMSDSSVLSLSSDDKISITGDNIDDNIKINRGTLVLGSAVSSLYSKFITIGNNATLNVANGTVNVLSNIKVPTGHDANMAIDFQDKINASASDVLGNILISEIDVSKESTTASSTLTTTIADKIKISPDVVLVRGASPENTPNYVSLTKTGTTGVLNATKSFLIDAIKDTADDRTYSQTVNETIVATTMTGNLIVKGSGQTVTSDANDAGGGIQVGSYTDSNNELKFTDISFDNIKVNDDNKGVFTVEGNNTLVIEADSHDVSIGNTKGGSKQANAIYLKGTAGDNSEAQLISKESRTIEIADDIRSDNVNNRLTLTGDGDIKLKGVLDPLTVDMDASNVYRYNRDEEIVWNLNGGVLHYANDNYLSGYGNTLNFNGGSLDLMNGAATNINLAALNVNANSNIFVDVNAETQKMDTLSAGTYNVNANLNVAGMNIFGTPVANKFETTFVDEETLGNGALIGHVTSSVSTVDTGVYKYLVSYVDDGTTGKFKYNVNAGHNAYVSYNPAVFSSSVAMQGAYLSQISNYDTALGNLDQTMLMTQEQRKALKYGNKYAANDETNPMVYSPLFSQNESNGIWFRPYVSFEKVQLENGPDVNNVMYGTLVGGDTEMIQIGESNWEGQASVYVGYNGSHQTFDGNGIYQNGGLVGATAALYNGNFFTALTASVGAHVADIKTIYGNNDLTMLTAGLASKTGYNWELFNGKMILQPSWTMSYTFLNPFNNYNMGNGVRLENDAMHAIQLVPGLKIIGNLPKGWQPYLGVNMRWNIIDDTKVKASYLSLPETSVKPYIEYGLGLQKMIGDRFTGFGQAMFRGGGRSGVSFTFGFRWALGEAPDKHQTIQSKKLSKKLNKLSK